MKTQVKKIIKKSKNKEELCYTIMKEKHQKILKKEFGNPHFFKKHKWGDILARLDKELWFETCGYNYLFGSLGCKFKKYFLDIDVNTEFETAFFKCNIKNNGGGSYGVYYIYIKVLEQKKKIKIYYKYIIIKTGFYVEFKILLL